MKTLAAILILSFLPVPQTKSNPKRDASISAPLPNSIEAERMILGAAVLNPSALLDVMPILRAEDFFLQQHRKIYLAMVTLSGKNIQIETISIMEELSRTEELESVGGVPYLSQLADGLPRLTNIGYYAKIVREKSLLRELIYSCQSITEQAFAQKDDAAKIIERGVSAMLSVAEGSSEAAGVRIREWADAARSAVEEIESERAKPEGVFRLKCGVGELDAKTSGLRRKELVLLVGPTSNGKSLLAQEFSTGGDDAGYSGIIFSPEMTAENIAIRDIAFEAGVPFWLTRRPELMTEIQLENLKVASTRERNIAIVDKGITPERVWAMSEARKRSRGLDFIVVDYDQLVIEAGINPDDESSFFGHQARFVTQAKEFSKRLDVCFLLVAQLRKMPPSIKDGKNPKPTLDDVYGASALRNAPDVVLWTIRDPRRFSAGSEEERKKFERMAYAYVLKSRNGITGKIDMQFDPIRLRLVDKPKGMQEFDPFADPVQDTVEES